MTSRTSAASSSSSFRLSRLLLALAAVATLGTATLVQAQPAQAGSCDGSGPHAAGRMAQGHGPMMGAGMGAGPQAGRFDGANFDPAARVQEHLTRLKQDLKLTAAQDGAWQAFAAQATKQAEATKTRRADREADMLTQRLKALQAQKDGKPLPTEAAPERMARRTEQMKQHLADMETMNQNVRTLYAALTPEQRKVADQHFDRLHAEGGRGMGHGQGRGHGRHG